MKNYGVVVMGIKRRYLYWLFVFIFVFLLFTNVIEAGAMNTGFKTNHLPTEDKNIFISNSDISLIEDEPAKKTIVCFDVNSNKLIAIGQRTSSSTNTICVYSSEGIFQYGYTFNCSGDFGVEWDEDNLNIYFVRSSVIVSVTPSGDILDVFEVQNTIENNSYENNFIRATERKIEDTEYIIENDMGIFNFFASSYSLITVKDSTGTERVIYDVSSTQHLNMILTIIAVCVLILVAIAVIVWHFIKQKRGDLALH